MTPEQIQAVALEFSQALDALDKKLDDALGRIGLVSARATRIETRQARQLIHMGLTHEGHAPAPSFPPAPPAEQGGANFKPFSVDPG